MSDNIKTIGGADYRIGYLTPRKQFHIIRRLAPLAEEVGKVMLTMKGKEMTDAAVMETLLLPLTATLQKMPDGDADFIIDAALAVCERKQVLPGAAVETFSPVMSRDGSIMFQDIKLPEMMQLVVAVLTESLGSFFAEGALTPPAAQESRAG